MPKCQWCGVMFGQLGKSHIIPTAFFNLDGKQDKYLLPTDNHKIRRRTGSWDPNILCQPCEAAYSHIDSRAADILLNGFEEKLVLFGDKRDELAVQLPKTYMQDIKRFLIYTLWKASVSTLPEFHRVSLGPYENRIRNQLINQDLFGSHDYSFMASIVDNPSGVILPHRTEKEMGHGCRYYTLDFGKFIFDVKVDSRKSPGVHCALAEHENPVFIKFSTTPVGRRNAMVRAVKLHQQWVIKSKNTSL